MVTFRWKETDPEHPALDLLSDPRTGYQFCPVRDRPLRGSQLDDDRWAEVVATGVPDPGRSTMIATCPPGTWVVSGGGGSTGNGTPTDSYPDGRAWHIYGLSGGQDANPFWADVICGN
ncbi:hypothetical protein GCM10009765_44300 [Fodinicola feengrottensis]|uniref:Uncharacterized protein n=1 Tax=Fodinicola feengrottensis TaxID=435914 RepID=A0ABN2HM09_9ACTN